MRRKKRKQAARRKAQTRPDRGLRIEPLEPRIAMSAAGLVDVGTQPEGGLSDKIVYTHAGHGYTTVNNGQANAFWAFQRPYLLGMVEDLGNYDQQTILADYLFRAGATVVPMRPIGYQTNEIILDNDDVEVTFSGAWSNSSSTIYFGDVGDVPYRFASTSLTETATATYRPNITEEGHYPVYAWTRYGSDRTEQLYRINHSGGSTEVTVNHRRVGNGLVYLGTYHFENGTAGSVEISNRSDETGRVVIADMIRFGNGMGDIDRGAGISGLPREDEAGLYWVQWHVDRSQGVPTSEYRTSSSDSSATVSLAPRYSEYMNRSTDGSLSDRVLVSFHSNAGGGGARGTLGLHNTNQGGNTPNQFFLADTLGQEVNDDLVAQNGQYEHNWFDRGNNVTFQTTFNYGELNNLYINNEFDATILETAFHDNQLDAELMRDPKARDAIGRATYQGIVKYFNGVDSGATSLTMLPGAVETIRAETAGPDSVTLTWTAPNVNSYDGSAPTGYMVYGSTNGKGFDGGTFVSGGGTTTYTVTGLDPAEGAYYFKVAAVNAGGEGVASEVAAAIPGNANASNILIVNGFDRNDRFLSPTVSYPGGSAQRIRPQNTNSFDYAVQVASSIEAYNEPLVVDTASNDMVENGSVVLTDYDAVIWILGEESTENETFSNVEQTLVSGYLAAGGQLLATGAEIGWDLDAQNGGTSFYNNSLRANYVADDANTYNVNAVPGSIFDGVASFAFDDGSEFYDAQFADVISPSAGSTAALTYSTGGTAAVQYVGGAGERVVTFGFPFETITTESARNAVMAGVLDFFVTESVPLQPLQLVLDNDDGPTVYSETGTWSNGPDAGFNGGTYRTAVVGESSVATWTFNAPYSGTAEVFVQYRAEPDRASNAQYVIEFGSGIGFAAADQQAPNLEWMSLGNFDISAGQNSVSLAALLSSGGTTVVADAVRVDLLPALNADFDGDADIDLFDLLRLQRGFGAGTTVAEGDADRDDDVDADDLEYWVTQAGAGSVQTAPSIAVQASTTAALVTGPHWLAQPIVERQEQAILTSEFAGDAALPQLWDRWLESTAPSQTSNEDLFEDDREPRDEDEAFAQLFEDGELA
ncbi:MAG: fibronectin type III domain-containing protein [Planctomycetota bacterium]